MISNSKIIGSLDFEPIQNEKCMQRSINKTKKSDHQGKFNTHMSVREDNWFLMDKRLLFVNSDEQVFKIWVKKLNALIN